MNYEEIADSVFKGYDIRGLYGEVISDEVAERLGKALGTFLKGKGEIAVGRDLRSSSINVYNNIIQGILSTGCDVVEIGEIPNPLVYFYTWKNKKISGVLITASHLEARFTGFKIINSNGISYIDELNELKNIFIQNNFLQGQGKTRKDEDAVNSYEEYWKKNLSLEKRLKVVIDSFYGAGSILVPGFFRKFGIDVIPLRNEKKDGIENLRLEPKSDNLQELQETIKKENADFGVAYDGDADRSVFVDNKGRVLLGGVIIVLLSKIFAKKNDTVVITIDCPSAVRLNLEKKGIKVEESALGHSFIEQKVFDERAVLGGEQSSHFYLGKYYAFSDGIASTLLMCQLIGSQNKKMSELVDSLGINPSQKLYVHCPDDKVKLNAVEELKNRFLKEFKQKKIITVDGIKVYLNDEEWFLIRPSNTAAEINLCVEAKDEKRLNELLKKYTKIIEQEVNKQK